MPLELVSFALCPFVQRSVITLLHKGVDFKLTYINLAHKPDWFQAISPLGKVPLLRIDDSRVLFESTAINEYLDETTLPRLLPDDPVERAMARGWISFGSTVLSDVLAVMLAGDERSLADAEATLCSHLLQLEQGVAPAPFYGGDRFTLVDATMAPTFLRLAWIAKRRPLRKWHDMKNLAAWSGALLDLPAVRESVPDNFFPLLEAHLQAKRSLLARMQG